MKIIDNEIVFENNGTRVIFMRIDPENIHITLRQIIDTLNDLSWISRFDKEYMRASYNARATTTVDYICRAIKMGKEDTVSKDAAEYIVSEVAREAIVSELKYKDIPLGELLKEKIAGNPGFDYYSQTLEEVLLFGEAKYLARQNAFGSGMTQVARFIKEKRDIADLADLAGFFSEKTLNGVINGRKAFSIAFAAKQTSSRSLIQNIQRNKHYSELLKYSELVFVAVNI